MIQNTKALNESRTIQIISWLTIVLVFLLAIGAFALSYNALRLVAIESGLPGWAAILWPLLIDFALVIFSLAVVRAYLKAERGEWPWFLVGVFTLATIGFNLVHAGGDVSEINLWITSIQTKYIVGIVPPLALVLSFESLMGMFKGEVARSRVTNSLKKLDILQTKRQAEMDKLLATIEASRSQVADIETGIKTKREQLAEAGRQPVVILGVEPDKLGPDARQPYIAQLIKKGVDEDTILRTFGISTKTLSRDIKALNGQVK